MTHRIVRPRQAGALAVIAAFAVAGCSSSTGAPSAIASALANASLPPVVAPVASASSEPTSTASEEASGTPEPTAVVTDIDPCQLVTSDDATAFTGVKMGAGKESTTEGNARICTYAGPGPNIMMVEVAIAPDVDTAKAAEKAAEDDLDSQAQENGADALKVTKMPGFADNTDAAMLEGGGSGGGLTLAARAMLLLRATTFLAFSDVAVGGGKPPSAQQFQDEANTLLGKVP